MVVDVAAVLVASSDGRSTGSVTPSTRSASLTTSRVSYGWRSRESTRPHHLALNHRVAAAPAPRAGRAGHRLFISSPIARDGTRKIRGSSKPCSTLRRAGWMARGESGASLDGLKSAPRARRACGRARLGQARRPRHLKGATAVPHGNRAAAPGQPCDWASIDSSPGQDRSGLGRPAQPDDQRRWVAAYGADPTPHCCSRTVASVSRAERQTTGTDELRARGERRGGFV